MDSDKYSNYTLQELYRLYTKMSQENKPDEAKLIFEQILIKEKPGNDSNVDNLASLTERLAAFIIDGVIMTFPIFTFILIFFGFNKFLEMVKQPSLLYITVTLIVHQVSYVAINGWLLYKYGQTVGKRTLDIKIVDLDNNLPELYKSYGLRYFVPALIPLVPLLGSFFWFVDVLFIFRKDRRCIHDHLAGTKVISAV